jgi:uncharacterized protein
MLDLTLIDGVDWDSGNERKNLEKHGVTQLEAEQAFTDPNMLIVPDAKHSSSEQRYHALGRSREGRVLLLSFTLRGEGRKIRVISARFANRKERAIYEET